MSAVDMNNIPAHYLTAGATTGFAPKPFERLCFLLMGASKTGKSSLCGGLPGYAYADMETGSHSIIGMQATRFKCPAYNEKDLTAIQKAEGCTSLKNLLGLLLKDSKEGKRYFQSVVFDSMEVLQTYVVADMSTGQEDIRDANNMGKNWSRIAEEMVKWPVMMQNNGYGWIAITHSKLTEDGSKLRPGIIPGSYQLLTAYADYILRIEKVAARGTGPDGKPTTTFKYVLRIEPSTKVVDDCAQGGRIALPASIDLPKVGGLLKLKETYNEAVKIATEEHKKFIDSLAGK